jgi:hypothetical protein
VLLVRSRLIVTGGEEILVSRQILDGIKLGEDRGQVIKSLDWENAGCKNTIAVEELHVSCNQTRGQMVETIIEDQDIGLDMGSEIGGFRKPSNVGGRDDRVVNSNVSVGTTSA